MSFEYFKKKVYGVCLLCIEKRKYNISRYVVLEKRKLVICVLFQLEEKKVSVSVLIILERSKLSINLILCFGIIVACNMCLFAIG